MKRAWLLPGERMPVGQPVAPQLRLARIEGWLRDRGYETTILFRGRLDPRSGIGRGTLRAMLDALASAVVAPWIGLRALRQRPAVVISSGPFNAHALSLVKRILGNRVIVIVDALGLRSLETEQTTRLAPLRRPFGWVWRRLERKQFGTADLVLAVNDRSAGLIRSIARDARVATLRDAAEDDLAEVEPASRERYGIPEDAVVVGFMGSIVCSRLDRLLSAWQAVRERASGDGPELHLVVIGSGPDLPRYREWAAREQVEGIIFLGALPREEALGVLRSCDVAYTGSWSQAGFSFKLFEYLGLGMPIVVERKPQMEEVLSDGENALFYEGPDELAAVIELLAMDGPLRERLGVAAGKTFLASHTLSRRREQFAALLAELDDGHRAPLHLLEVGLSWPPETFVGWRLAALAQRGVRITVAGTPRLEQDLHGRPLFEGVDFMKIPYWGDSRRVKLLSVLRHGMLLLLRHPRRLRQLVREVGRTLPPDRRDLFGLVGQLHMVLPLARLKPDVVHFDWETAAITFLPLYGIWDCPVVVSCHGAGVSRHPMETRWGDRLRDGLPKVFERAAAVHCVAEEVAGHAIRYGARPDAIRVIRTSVDPAAFSPDGSGDGSGTGDGGPLRITGVATLIPTKGFEYALVAIRELVDREVPVRYQILGGEPGPFIGEPSDLDRILYTIGDLELAPYVEVCGRVPSEQVRDTLRRTDIFLHSSLSDGLPTVIAEAMSCAVPVVVTDAGGTKEMVDDGVEGFVVAPRDPSALADRIETLWGDTSLRSEMGLAARARVEREFSLDSLAEQFEGMLRSVVSGAGG
jgi:glycosyltransferase involved in cell wall biosynthesis